MVAWYDREVALADEVVNVDVSELDFRDDKGKLIKTLPIKDLSNAEVRNAQQDPDVKDLEGRFDELTPKGYTLGLLLTYRRMFKGAGGNLGFGFITFLKWKSSTTNKLMEIFRKALGDVEKKSETLPSPTQDKSSETS